MTEATCKHAGILQCSTLSWDKVGKKKKRQNYYVNDDFMPSEGQMTSCYDIVVAGTEKRGGKND